MANKQTFSQFFGDFLAARAQAPYTHQQRLGAAFTDALYAAGREDIANALVYMACDPFYHEEISTECLDFVMRVW